MNVVVYTTPTCPYCHQAKGFLSQRGVKFTEYDVSMDRAAADEVIRKSGRMEVPVITIDDQVVVGFDRARFAMPMIWNRCCLDCHQETE
jgi:glutaredoxin-like YruB-family protein